MAKQGYKEEYVKVNGVEHYVLHYAHSARYPVVLFLHGGPGNAESLFAYTLDGPWGGFCTQVHYDQRGAGKTYQRNKKAVPPQSINQMVSDLHGIVEHLKKQYMVEKVVLLGHSWGTLLGSLYTLQYPENVRAYIGTGQVVNMRQNERAGFEMAKKQAQKAGNKKHVSRLEQLGNYPPEDVDELLKMLPKVRKIQESYEKGTSFAGLVKPMLKSPVFKLADLFSMLGAMKVNKALIPQMIDFDLYSQPLTYEVPVHYILGATDTTTPTALSEVYFTKISAPNKSITVLERAGHSPMFEQTEKFSKALEKILASL